MEFFKDFLSQYGVEIMYAIITFIAGYFALYAKSLITKWFDDKTKKSIAKTCVKAVEQIYKDLHGEDKLNEALKGASAMLTEKGIQVTELELRWLIESAVAEFNDAFNKTSTDTANSNDK